MKQFQHKSVTPSGQRIEGLVQAKDHETAVNILKEKGLIVISLVDVEKTWNYKMQLYFSKVSGNDLVNFTQQFASMVNAGLSLVNTMAILKKSSKPALAQVIQTITADIEGGDELYKALSKHPQVFPPLYVALVKAGELSGKLGEVLEDLAENLERQMDFRSKVKSALLYPIIMLTAMLGVSVIMIFFIMPMMGELYKEFGAKMPYSTSLVINASAFIRDWWFMGVIPAVLFVVVFLKWISTPEGKDKWDRFTIRIPYIGALQRKVVSTDIVRTLAMLIRSGVGIIESLNIVSEVASSRVYQLGILSAAKNVEKGLTLADSLEKEYLFPDMVISMVKVGEETGKMDEMLVKLSRQFQKDSEVALKNFITVIEPVMILVLGVGVVIWVMAVIMPIYNLTTQV